MTGLVLEGGGVRGSYEAGAYMAMWECGINIDGVIGTSIGALNGAVIASGEGYKLPKIWRKLSMGHVFGFSDDFIKAMVDKDININFFKLSITSILGIIANKGILFEGLKKVIEENLDKDKLFNSKIDFGICTVRFKDLKPLYLWKKDMDKDKIKDYILASSSLPIFRREKLIDDNYYLDGGFYDLGPVNELIRKGYDKIYLVKVKGIGFHRKYPEDANVTVIESKRSLGKVMDLDKNRVIENIKMGYYDGIRVLKNLDGEKFVFKRKSENYYNYINRKVSGQTYNRVRLFFKGENYKETTIRAIEYIMEKEGINYYQIYKVGKVIRLIKKKYKKKHFIYDYVRKLKGLI